MTPARISVLVRLLFLAVLAIAVPASGRGPSNVADAYQVVPNEADLASHAHYKNKDGQDVHSPSKSKSGKVPQGASAQCRDGSYSFSTHHRGTCSHHGGVTQWLQ